MKIRQVLFVLLLVFGWFRPAFADGVVPGHILVKPLPGYSILAIAAEYRVRVEDQIPGTQVYSLTRPQGETEEAFAARIGLDPRLQFAEIDTYLVNPEIKGDPVHLAFDKALIDRPFISQWTAPVGVYPAVSPLRQVDLGFSQQRTIGAGITVAVLDTGIDFRHPLLSARLLPGYNVLQPATLPWEQYDGRVNSAVGHGTMVAGIIARIAPGARILPIRVLDGDGIGTSRGVAKGLMFALFGGARVANLSLGSAFRSRAVEEALDLAEAQGMVCVTTAGNQGAKTQQYPTSRKEVIVVASVGADNTRSAFSNYGGWVTIAAPGSGIRSTYLNGGYATWSGTSFAAPFVSGAAALALSIRPSLTSKAMKSLLCGTARSIDGVNPAYKGQLGKGLLDIEAAIRRL